MDPTKEEHTQVSELADSKPNESTGIYVRGFMKITDPDSGEVIVEKAN